MMYFSEIFVLLMLVLLLTVLTSVQADNSKKFNFLEKNEMTAYACSAIESIKPELRTSYLQLIKSDENTCLISAYNAFKQWDKPQTVLIDTRNNTQYQKFSIPGSLNIPQHVIKTKAFLKNKHIILINDGRNTIGLNKTCHELKAAGFQTQVVIGGLNGWFKISNPNSNEPHAVAELEYMSPDLFHYELLLPDTLLISLTESPSVLEPQFKYNTHFISNQQTFQSIVTQIKRLLKNKPVTQRIFLYDQNDSLSPILKSHLREQLREPVFYLKGGVVAYNVFQQKRQAMLKRLKYPPQTLYRCRG